MMIPAPNVIRRRPPAERKADGAKMMYKNTTATTASDAAMIPQTAAG